MDQKIIIEKIEEKPLLLEVNSGIYKDSKTLQTRKISENRSEENHFSLGPKASPTKHESSGVRHRKTSVESIDHTSLPTTTDTIVADESTASIASTVTGSSMLLGRNNSQAELEKGGGDDEVELSEVKINDGVVQGKRNSGIYSQMTASAPSRPKVTTKIFVGGMCCPSEVPIVHRILEELPGVESVNVVVMAKRVIVEHDSILVPSARLVHELNKAHLDSRLLNEEIDCENCPTRSKGPPVTLLFSGLCWAISMTYYLHDLRQFQPCATSGWCQALKKIRFLGVVSVLFGIPPILKRARGALGRCLLDVNALITVAIIGALCLGDFPEAAAVVFLFSIGEYLESRATEKTRSALSELTSMKPETAERLNGETIPADDVVVGDILAVRVGFKIPVDGKVVRGAASIDESQMTGESMAVEKRVGSEVHAGTVSVDGYIEIQATKEANNSAAARIGRLVEEAAQARSPTEEAVETFAKIYTPIMVLIAVLMVVIPFFIYGFKEDSNNLHHETYWHEWIDRATQLLVTACPCALVISTPITYISALITCTSSQILVKGGKYLETCARVGTILIDKTGTLTEGLFEVRHFEMQSDSSIAEKDALIYLGALESIANHPLSDAIVSYVMDKCHLNKHHEWGTVHDFKVIPGEGIEGFIDGQYLSIGNKRLVQRKGWIFKSSSSGTRLYYGINNKCVAIIDLGDCIRPSAKSGMTKLRDMGISTVMLTGDNANEARAIGTELGIDEVHAELLPENKIEIVEKVKNNQKKFVAMVGDGINDAAALARADIGIAMGASGTALAIETANVTLLDSNLDRLAFLIQMGRRTRRKIIFNILFSVITKCVVVISIFCGQASLWMAIMVDVGSMLLVTLNGMMLMSRRTQVIGHSRHHGHTHGEGECSGHGHSHDQGHSHSHGHSEHSHSHGDHDVKQAGKKKKGYTSIGIPIDGADGGHHGRGHDLELGNFGEGGHGHSHGSGMCHGHSHGAGDHGHGHGAGDKHGHDHGHGHGADDKHGHGHGADDKHGHDHGHGHGADEKNIHKSGVDADRRHSDDIYNSSRYSTVQDKNYRHSHTGGFYHSKENNQNHDNSQTNDMIPDILLEIENQTLPHENNELSGLMVSDGQVQIIKK